MKDATPPARLPSFDPDSRLKMRELRVTPEDGQFLVGDMERGEFIAVPPIAVTVISALQDGLTISEVGVLASEETGSDIDVADFVATLLELGFVTQIDGIVVADDDSVLGYGGRVGDLAVRLARPFYTAPAWAVYCALTVACGVALVTMPRLRPHYWQTFFLSNPVLSLALLTVVTMVIGCGHELAHWLGARIEGVPVRITVSRRYYLLVLQTDLSALWSVPRRRRLGPLMAGIAFDVNVSAILLLARVAQLDGWWRLPSAVSNLIAAVIFWQIVSISVQFALFLRTDIYAVLVVGLGCQNLTRVSRLRMKRWWQLTDAEKQELDAASQRDLTVARWYGWIQLAGLLLMILYLIVYVIPVTLATIRWVAVGVIRSAPASPAFWDALLSGCVALVPVALPALVYVRERQRQRRSPKRVTGR